MDQKLFSSIYIDNKSDKTLVLLHGTGGTESDFLFLDDLLENKFNIISIRGNVSENGMPRFFKRISFGVFDQKSIEIETDKFSRFIKARNLDPKKTWYLGYSNGANMILATLFYYPELVEKAVLLHAMLPFEPEDIDLSEAEVFFSYGLNDHMITPEQSKEAIEKLKTKKARIQEYSYPGGHEISEKEIDDVIKFLN